MIESRPLRRAIANCLRSGVIDPEAIRLLVEVAEGAFPGDEFVGRLLGKLLGRHRTKPGRKRTSASAKQRLADAAIWARFNQAAGREIAAAEAARLYKVKTSAVYRAAFERKDPEMNRIIRETPDNFSGPGEYLCGDTQTNVVPIAGPKFKKDSLT